ncbi:Processive diacylglycerol glucosyltransferase [Variovorax sp. PBS-H4]|uniref:glycosyltransferase n=1 Tax=Variovorax sp. PBS-H4 TaxID=434008 RepID=UPI0013176A06|nr:glycosyltransferase [Variovorax sp. PBS-H4]VTU40574.1 Processive diacylglycerol glucosyltransferase [Variovorax sp. PBS-H4]
MTRAPLPTPSPALRRTVDLVYFNAGGGHRASAIALEAAIHRAALPWRVRLVNLREVLDPHDGFRKLTGMDPEDVYNKRLARGWTLGLTHELKVLQAVIRWAKPKLVRLLQQHWLATEPDMVVSLVPNFNRSLWESVATSLPGVPYVTVLTDLADHPPHFWIEKGQDQYFVCGSAKAVQQARSAGYAEDRIHATSGMMIRTAFYETGPLDRAEERSRLGLDPERPTGLVLFGGQGSKAMAAIAKRLPDVQLILACGHNESLAQTLRALPTRAPRLVLGFTPEVAYYMQLSDFFIGKPGPGSISEAVQLHLPVIVVCNSWTLPQERYNAQWVREQGVGLVRSSYAKVPEAVEALLRDLDRYRAATHKVRNRAVFELPGILQSILARSEMRVGGATPTAEPEPLRARA